MNSETHPTEVVQNFVDSFNAIAAGVHLNAKLKGWWDTPAWAREAAALYRPRPAPYRIKQPATRKMNAGSMRMIATHRVQAGGDQTWTTGADANPHTSSAKPASDRTEKTAL